MQPARTRAATRLPRDWGCAATDCDLGLTLSHGGGYPGYGSHVLILPEFGIGIFALSNRTYAGPRAPLWDAAVALLRAGQLQKPPTPIPPALATAYAAVRTIFESGIVTGSLDLLAMNFLMDQNAADWARGLYALKAGVGPCDTTSSLVLSGALSGDFTWNCERGRVKGALLLAPTPTPQIQSLSLTRASP